MMYHIQKLRSQREREIKHFYKPSPNPKTVRKGYSKNPKNRRKHQKNTISRSHSSNPIARLSNHQVKKQLNSMQRTNKRFFDSVDNSANKKAVKLFKNVTKIRNLPTLGNKRSNEIMKSFHEHELEAGGTFERSRGYLINPGKLGDADDVKSLDKKGIFYPQVKLIERGASYYRAKYKERGKSKKKTTAGKDGRRSERVKGSHEKPPTENSDHAVWKMEAQDPFTRTFFTDFRKTGKIKNFVSSENEQKNQQDGMNLSNLNGMMSSLNPLTESGATQTQIFSGKGSLPHLSYKYENQLTQGSLHPLRHDTISSMQSIRDLPQDLKIGDRHINLNLNWTGINWSKRLYKYDPYFRKQNETAIVLKRLETPPVFAYSVFTDAQSTRLALNAQNNELSTPYSLTEASSHLRPVNWKKCRIEAVMEEGTYLITWLDNPKKFKACDRMNLRFEWEDEVEFLDRREQALNRRYKEVYFENLKLQLESKELTKNKVFFPVEVAERILGEFLGIDSGFSPETKFQIGEMINEVLELYHYKLNEFTYFYQINGKDYVKMLSWIKKQKNRETISKEGRGYDSKASEIVEISEEAYEGQMPVFKASVRTVMDDNLNINFGVFLAGKDGLVKKYTTESFSRKLTVYFYKQKTQLLEFRLNQEVPKTKLVPTLRGLLFKKENLLIEKLKIKLKKLTTEFFEEFLKKDFFTQKYKPLISSTSKDSTQNLEKNLKISTKILKNLTKIQKKFSDLIFDTVYPFKRDLSIETLNGICRFSQNIYIAKIKEFCDFLTKLLDQHLCGYSLSAPIPFLEKPIEKKIISYIDYDHRLRGLKALRELDCWGEFKETKTTLTKIHLLESNNTFEADRNIFRNCMITLIKKSLDFPDVIKLESRLPEFGRFKIPMKLNSSTQKGQKDFSKMSQERRAKFIQKSRYFLYNADKSDFKIISDSILDYITSIRGLKAKKPLDSPILGNELWNNGQLLGWINFSGMILEPESRVFETLCQIMRLMMNHFIQLEEFETFEFNHIKSIKKTKRKIEFWRSSTLTHLKGCQKLLRYSLIGIFSLVFIINKLKFLLLLTKSMLDQALFPKLDGPSGGNIHLIQSSERMILKEIKFLNRDRQFVKQVLKDSFGFGLLEIDLRSLKTALLDKIDGFLKHIHTRAIQRCMQSYKYSHSQILEIRAQIKVKPGSLEEFINIKNRIKSKKFNGMMESVERSIGYLQALLRCLDKLMLPYDAELIYKAMKSKAEFGQVKRQCMLLNENLKVSKFEFYDEILLYTKEVMTEFEQL